MKITLVVSIALVMAFTLALPAQDNQRDKDTDLLDMYLMQPHGTNYGDGAELDLSEALASNTAPIALYLALQATPVADNAADDDSFGSGGALTITKSAFPNANEEGFAIPLLPSCSSIITLGQLYEPYSTRYSPSYKPNDESASNVMIMKDSIHVSEKPADRHGLDRTTGTYVEHFVVSHDYPTKPYSSYIAHHKVSDDLPDPTLVVGHKPFNHTLV